MSWPGKTSEKLSSLGEEGSEIIQGHLKSVKEAKDVVDKLKELDSEIKEYQADVKHKTVN